MIGTLYTARERDYSGCRRDNRYIWGIVLRGVKGCQISGARSYATSSGARRAGLRCARKLGVELRAMSV